MSFESIIAFEKPT